MRFNDIDELETYISTFYGHKISYFSSLSPTKVYVGYLTDYEFGDTPPWFNITSENGGFEYSVNIVFNKYANYFITDLDSIYNIDFSSIGSGGSSQPTETIDYTEQFNKTNQLQFFTIVLLSILIGCILGKIISKMLRGL